MTAVQQVAVQQVDLSLRDHSRHPHIEEDKEYLVLYDSTWYLGVFEEQWYGWNFMGWENPAGQPPATGAHELALPERIRFQLGSRNIQAVYAIDLTTLTADNDPDGEARARRTQLDDKGQPYR